jgi:glycosyltransferase involved in cell wall biosynthesis
VFHVLDGSFCYMIGDIAWQRTVVTVHDLIPALQCRGRFHIPPPGWAARRLIGQSLARISEAGAVQAVSSQTATDVLALTGRAANAVLLNPLRSLPGDGGAEAASALDEAGSWPFILHVGNNSFYKNRPGAVNVFASLALKHATLRLVMAGAAPDVPLRALVSRHGLDNRITFIVNPDDHVLAALYRRAALLLFPSFYEGFGWPPLEAMRFECPVVCSNVASLPEVVGDAALLCDPEDTAGMAGACMRILSEPAVATELRSRGVRNLRRFDTATFAAGFVKLYEGLAMARSSATA